MVRPAHYVRPSQPQTHAQNSGVTLNQRLSDRLATLVAGPTSPETIPYWWRRSNTLETGDEVLNESLTRTIGEVCDILEISREELDECKRFFTSARQKSLYHDRFDIVTTIGEEVDLEDVILDRIDVFKLIYAVCSDGPAAEQIDDFFKSALLRSIPRYFKHPHRPPPKHLIMQETWKNKPLATTESEGGCVPASQDHYARLLIIARDGGMEVDAPVFRKYKGIKWTCKVAMYMHLVATERSRRVPPRF
ncbi:uncharacterized protein DFL_000049 [Arthrobotrys flagrans]|uniref:Uncharacterized protein n=1 Tax=Arthrobotrys flagrans TaxID=97331 RepID=A0A437ACN0_ARTFL|nr:hypothetical protein DFL_000049 [Arthrobotrys flagrans]